MQSLPVRGRIRAGRAGAVAAALLLASPALFAQIPAPWTPQGRGSGSPVDAAATLRRYAPQEQRLSYRGVRVQRDLAYGVGARQRVDLFVPLATGSLPTGTLPDRPILILAAPKVRAGRSLGEGHRLYDNVALWAAHHGMIGIVMRPREDRDLVWPDGPRDFAALIPWLQAHARNWYGEPRRLIVVGADTGGSELLSYLSHRQYWCCRGPGLAAAVLFGAPLNLAPRLAVDHFLTGPSPPPGDTLLAPAHSDLPGLDGIYVPVFIAAPQLEDQVRQRSAILLQQELCRRGRCPTVRSLVDHSALSALLSFDTADDSVSRQLLAWMQAQQLMSSGPAPR